MNVDVNSGHNLDPLNTCTSARAFKGGFCAYAISTEISYSGYKTFFILNSAKQKIYPAHKLLAINIY